MDLSSLAGRTVRFRVGVANNQGKLLVGVDNVALRATFADTAGPVFTSAPHLRNPGFLSGTPPLPTTSDPTIVGHANDDSSVNSVRFVENDLHHQRVDATHAADDNRLTALHAVAHSSPTLPCTQ